MRIYWGDRFSSIVTEETHLWARSSRRHSHRTTPCSRIFIKKARGWHRSTGLCQRREPWNAPLPFNGWSRMQRAWLCTQSRGPAFVGFDCIRMRCKGARTDSRWSSLVASLGGDTRPGQRPCRFTTRLFELCFTNNILKVLLA